MCGCKDACNSCEQKNENCVTKTATYTDAGTYTVTHGLGGAVSSVHVRNTQDDCIVSLNWKNVVGDPNAISVEVACPGSFSFLICRC